MLKTFPVLPLALAIGAASASAPALAAFVEDSQLNLNARNFYMNRDFRDNAVGNHKAEEWGQGFMLRYNSGFTEGPLGFGVDGLGLLGIKLDGGDGTGGANVLPRNRVTGETPDEWSFLGLTGKARFAQSVLSVGTHEPLLPVAYRNDTRLLPQTFEGAQLVSKDIDKLTLTAGQFRSTRLRDSTNYEDMKMAAFAEGGALVGGGVDSDRFNYAGASYAPLANLTASYFYAELEDNYHQHYGNLLYSLPLAEGMTLKTDIRYFDSGEEGNTTVDNRNLGAMFTLAFKGHAFGVAYQDQSGDTGLPFIAGGTDPWALNTVTYHHFLRAREDSWQARYDYDFAALGMPGLTLMSRYVSGDNFKIGGAEAKEWERDIDLGYVIQSGPLKNVGLRLRNVAYRGSHTTDIDENRVIVNYTVKLW
ncbi:outer membrane porin, OprD family [Geopseudomonas sagittaria]|uniref:Outer membrane porin, OprD family n=1 Tax=Geopseudomonas sagittaria TaxID=1135990 RepID=A0A1I5RAT0_9GAMM|nr:OprD family porin [Pseudomonas sagittaria]SFP55619.1 outer membrane porin, OprD family [Pseudomonas sagittaria]